MDKKNDQTNTDNIEELDLDPENSNLENERLFAIDLRSVVSSVVDRWRDFKRQDLVKFGDAIESVLRLKGDDIFHVPDDVRGEKYANEIRTEYERRDSPSHSPLPLFIVRYNRTTDSNVIISIEQDIVLTPDDKEFLIFLAFKFAVLDGTLISGFIDYLFMKHYEQDFKRFVDTVEFLLVDYSWVLGERKGLIRNAFNAFKEDKISSSLSNESLAGGTDQDIEMKLKDTNDDNEKMSLRHQVMMIHYLIEACRESKTDAPTMADKARVVHIILGKKVPKKVGGSNIYKYLSDILTDDDYANVKNLQFIKQFFEKLLLGKPIDLINKEIKGSAE